MSNYQRTLVALQSEYRLVAARERYGPFEILAHRISDPDSLLDDEEILTASHDELSWHPYWVHSGPAARAICELIAALPLKGVHVLDLGCGLGLTSAVAACAGAIVTACDHAPPAIEFAKLNTQDFKDQVQLRLFDWRRDELPGKFELIIGSDILYNRADLPFLLKIFRRNLIEGGMVLLGDPARPLTNDLLKQIPGEGWSVERKTIQTLQGDARIAALWRQSLKANWRDVLAS